MTIMDHNTPKDLDALEAMIDRCIEVMEHLEQQPFDWAYNLDDVISVAGSLNKDMKEFKTGFTYLVGFVPAHTSFIIFPSTALQGFKDKGGTVIRVH